MSIISEENLKILEESGLNEVLKNSFHPRVVIVGDGEPKKDNSIFINQSEYVVRTDFGRNLPSKKVGYKTDMLYLDREKFTPFDSESMSLDFDNYLHKKCFDDCREIWLPIHSFLMNETYQKNFPSRDVSQVSVEMLSEAWDDEASREVLYYHIKQLYCFYKPNVKMLDFEEYQDLVKSCNMSSYINPLIYTMQMALIDSRFKKYDVYITNHSIKNTDEIDYLNTLIDSGKVKILD